MIIIKTFIMLILCVVFPICLFTWILAMIWMFTPFAPLKRLCHDILGWHKPSGVYHHFQKVFGRNVKFADAILYLMEPVVGENGKRMDLMSKNKDYEVLYALRDKKTKKIVRATKCKGGSFYKNRYMCEKRCTQFNDVHKLANCTNDFEYEVGEYAVVDIEKYKELIGEKQ